MFSGTGAETGANRPRRWSEDLGNVWQHMLVTIVAPLDTAA
jgi:hypothetical protein